MELPSGEGAPAVKTRDLGGKMDEPIGCPVAASHARVFCLTHCRTALRLAPSRRAISA